MTETIWMAVLSLLGVAAWLLLACFVVALALGLVILVLWGVSVVAEAVKNFFWGHDDGNDKR